MDTAMDTAMEQMVMVITRRILNKNNLLALFLLK